MSRGTQEACPASQSPVVYRAVTVSGRSFQIVRLTGWFVTPCDGPYNPTVQARWFGLVRVRSPLLAESLLFSLPVGTEMVHFPTLSSLRLWIQRRILRVYQRGFPHSEIPGSKLVCSSPGLIAAYRVLHRLLAPRHSPYALSSLTIRNSNLRRELPARKLRAACVSSMHTACLWSEKTTVCRIFS